MFFLVIRNSSNKRGIGGAALIRGRRLLTFLSQMRRLIEGGAYSSKYGIQLFRERLSNKTVRDNAERYYGKWGFMVFDWGFRCFSDIEGNITNKYIYAFSFLVGKHREPQSINAKLFLRIIPIGIVAYALTLLWDNLCRNSCIQLDGDTELARAVDVMMARAKRIYILIIKVNKLFSFFS